MRVDPAYAGRQRFDIADIVRRHRAALEAEQDLTVAQRRVLSAIELCRTAALGGHVDVCRSCGYEHYHYHSCRNRHCPKCQALAQERWIAARTERLLAVQHFHVVFTLPAELRALTKYHPREVFAGLFASASATLLELGRTRLGARLGVTMVLHTWTRDLRFHPHVHAIVTAGGLALDGSRWASSSSKYLFPVKVMGVLLRGKMMAALRKLHRDGVFDSFNDFCDPEAFERLMTRLARKSWVVYAKKPFREIDHVVAYLGRYTHRVAISNSRLIEVTDETVTFRTKNGKTATLAAIDFVRRFIQHVLPKRLHKIRHYGLYSGAQARSGGCRDKARNLLPASSIKPVQQAIATTWTELLQQLTSRDISSCPVCGGSIERRSIPVASCRDPPWSRAS
ncbi:IS91 family transposase [Desulfobulbus sp. AH-315-M07]|nr:IS91 family transposase [Desulfobulbus sp. AH-315-M07]